MANVRQVSAGKPLKILVSGLGNRAVNCWIPSIVKAPEWEMVGGHDIAEGSIARCIAECGIEGGKCCLDLEEAIERFQPDALLVASSMKAHAAGVRTGLEAGLDVMVEKPYVTDLGEGLELIDLAEEKGLVLSVTQSGRGYNHLDLLCEAITGGRIGTPGYMTIRMLRNRDYPELPQYQRGEEYPLLQAIVIHHVDMLRQCFAADIEAVWAHSFNPSWSSYESYAAGFYVFRLENGVEVCYQGSFSSRNPALPTQYWVIEGSEGSLWQESDWGNEAIMLARLDDPEPVNILEGVESTNSDDEFLKAFYCAIVAGTKPLAPASDNIHTLAAVHAAIESSKRGDWVRPADLLAEARR